eukprot:gene10981-biopygen3083
MTRSQSNQINVEAGAEGSDGGGGGASLGGEDSNLLTPSPPPPPSDPSASASLNIYLKWLTPAGKHQALVYI